MPTDDGDSTSEGEGETSPPPMSSRDGGSTMSPDATTAPATDLTGAWSGTWTSSGLSGTTSGFLVQEGTQVFGSVSMPDAPCFTEASVDATISGTSMSGTFDGGGSLTSFTATLFAGAAGVRLIEGTFTVASGECAGVGGEFTLSR